jgi:hypothetical protein
MGALTLEESRCDFAAEMLHRQGRLRLRAFGTSMLPNLWPGDVALVQSCTFADVERGDIVLCRREGGFQLHRVVSKTECPAQLITRGDAMPCCDTPTTPQEILGKTQKVIRRENTVVSWRKPPLAMRLLGRVFAHSDLCLRITLRLRTEWERLLGKGLTKSWHQGKYDELPYSGIADETRSSLVCCEESRG